MSIRIAIGGICEQDLDLFFVEEIVSNSRFRDWLLSKLPKWPDGFDELIAAERSVEQVNGESDLELILREPSGCLAKVLIENKIAAAFQPQQLRRYRERAALYRERSECVHAVVVLIAPQGYAPRKVAEVDAAVSYEEVEEFLSSTDPDERMEYKLCLLRSAVTKYRRGYNPETDDEATAFWRSYWQAAKRAAPELEMAEPGPKPAGAGFVWFFPSRLPGNLNPLPQTDEGARRSPLPRLG